MPAYDVKDYLADCLDSILGQSHTALEVVVVDDGSTDGTGELADRIAESDSRVRVVHQANAGLGAARNEGTRHATGEYLAFADSDDLVVEDAYARMVGALERSGSDLAIGAVERLDGERRFMTPLMRENHEATAYGVSAGRRAADAGRRLRVEQGVPAVVLGRGRPVLPHRRAVRGPADADPGAAGRLPVRRARGPGLPVAGARRRLLDQPAAGRPARPGRPDPDQALEHGRGAGAGSSERTREVWFRRVLPVDMWEYFRAVPGCSAPTTGPGCATGCAEFWGPDTVPFERTALPLRQRIMGWLVDQDLRNDLEEFLAYVDAHGGTLPRRVVDGREVVDHPFRERPGCRPELLR